MKLGIMSHGIPTADGGDSAAAYRRWVELCQIAEGLGYWSVWVTEHHFASDTTYRPYDVPESEWPTVHYDNTPDSLTLLTYLAAKTTTLRLGTGVKVALWDDPLRVAERAAMLDQLSGGRLELGLGKGAPARENEVWDVPLDDPERLNRQFREAIEVIRRAWTGERFAFDGEHYSYPEVAILPRPARQPAPIFFGCLQEESFRYAGANGFPYATVNWPPASRERIVKGRAAYFDAARDAGQDLTGVDQPHLLYMYCGESDDEAEETTRYWGHRHQLVIEAHHERARPGSDHSQMGDRVVGSLDGVQSNIQQLIDFHVIGGPKRCLERVEELRDVLGMGYLVLITGWGPMPYEQNVASLRRFAEHVLPNVAEVPTRAASTVGVA